MDIDLQLQIISIIIAVFVVVVGVLTPVLVAILGVVYFRRLEERIESNSAVINELLDRISALEDDRSS